MGTSLSGLTPATTFDGLLKTSDNDALGTGLKTIGTGDGTDSVLQLSDSQLNVAGQFTVDTDTAATIMNLRGDGLNINQVYQANNTTYNTIAMVNSAGIQFRNLNNTVAVIRSDKFGLGIGSSTIPSATAHIKGSGATPATTSLLVQNSAGTQLFRVRDDNEIAIGSAITIQSTRISAYNSLGLNTYTDNGWETNFLVTGNGASSKVGIGETTPTARLHVKGSGNTNTTTSLLVQNSDGTQLFKVSDFGYSEFNQNATFYGSVYISGSIIGAAATKIGIGGPIPASTQAYIKGSGATSATTALLVQNSAGTDLLKVEDGGTISAQIINLNNSATVDRSIRFGAGSTYVNKGSVIVGHTYPRFGQVNETYNTLHDISNYTSSSGTGTYTTLGIENTINQTGTASGITRGVYVNPTLTSAVDYRAIETTAGNVVFGNLPTSATGLPTGAIYNDAGTLKIV